MFKITVSKQKRNPFGEKLKVSP